MVKNKRGFIFNIHLGSIIRPLWSAGFGWKSGLFVTASQPVGHLVACIQLRQELFLSLSLSCACYAGKMVGIVSVVRRFSRKHEIGSHPFCFAACFFTFLFIFLSPLLCDSVLNE